MRDLEYQHPLLDEIPVQKEFEHKILPGEHVTLTEGTGCVHTAPGHGPDDFEIGKQYGLPIFCPVDEAGLFKEEAGKYKGEFVKDADPYIIADLDVHGLLIKRRRNTATDTGSAGDVKLLSFTWQHSSGSLKSQKLKIRCSAN